MSSSLYISKPLRGEGGNGDLRSLRYPVALFLAVFAVLIMAFAVSDASDEADAATSGDDGNIHWSIYDGTLTLSRQSGQTSGDMRDYSETRPAWKDGDGWSNVTKVVIQDDVTSIGNCAFHDCTSLASVAIGDHVGSIGSDAFNGCESLGSVTIPGSVESIGARAFQYCTSLTSATIGNSVTSVGDYAFYNCTKLESATIPGSVKTIGIQAFYGCTSLTSVDIGNSVTSIGSNAFYGCTSLNTVYYNASNLNTDSWPSGDILFIDANGGYVTGSAMDPQAKTFPSADAFKAPGGKAFKEYNTAKDGKGTSQGPGDQYSDTGKKVFYAIWVPATSGDDGNIHWSISDDTLTLSRKDGQSSGDMRTDYTSSTRPAWESGGGWSDVTKVVIQDDVTSIGNYAFHNRTSLASVTFGNNSQLGSIGDYVFYGCTSITSVTIPGSVTSLGGNVFNGCTKLTSVIFGNNSQLGSIGDQAFSGCTELASVAIPDSVTSIENYAFCFCTELASVAIPDSVTSIGDYAFSDCTKLTSVIFGNNSQLGSIGVMAFHECSSLGSITIPAAVTSIGDDAFYTCKSLASVIFGNESKLTSIGKQAFCECTSLSSITIPAAVTSIGKDAFFVCGSLNTVYYNPSGLNTDSWPSGNILFIDANGGYVTGSAMDADKKFPSAKDFTAPEGKVFKEYNTANDGTGTSQKPGDQYSLTEKQVFYAIWGSATSGDDGNIHWVISGDTLTLSKKDGQSSGDMRDYSDETRPAWESGVGWDSVTKVVIQDDVTSIGNCAFQDCTSLASVAIGDFVTSIGGLAFYRCTSLESVTIPGSITSIGDWAFSGCTSLASISVDGNNAQYSSQDGVLFDKEKTELIQYPIGNISTSYSIPNSVGTIEDSAFEGCSALESVTIPGSVKSIGASAFDGCTSLTSVTIPGSVKFIGSYAFYECTSLTSVTIGNSVETIRSSAFCYCTSLATIIFETDTWNITSIGENQFALGTQAKSVSATVYSKSNIADGKLNDYGGSYTSFAYQQLLLVTVTFDANGGTPATQTRTTDGDGKISDLPSVSKDGCTFDGWYTQAEGGQKISTSYVFSQDTTVYAHWTASPSPGPTPGPTPSSGGGIPVIAIVGAVIAIIALAGAAVFLKKR